MELAAGRNLEKPFSPQSLVSLPQLLLRDFICDSTEYIQSSIRAFLRMPAESHYAYTTDLYDRTIAA